MNARELRLRERIDRLLAERDVALEQFNRCRDQRAKLRTRVRELERSRDLWRQRATRH